mmetsp:Transcript_75014/g.160675  ORF Transcript_75014/g.160675 Transcript_75014/m.160675 type:complete len:562 (-) Transcript_75014:105-1790(-)
MGVSGGLFCKLCESDKAEASQKVSSAPLLQQPKGRQHDGQHRANLQVKDGGFALRNFAATNRGKIEDVYELNTKIGEGGFGTVRVGKDKSTGSRVAVKSVKKSAVEEAARLHEEIEIMRLLDHPNIVRFIESFEDRRSIYLVLELCEGGELFDRIVTAGYFHERLAAGCFRQMLLAVNYLHQNRIMHRDLKPENWLLGSKEEVGKAPLKLIDFGISRRFQPGVPARTKAGTPNYVAPEVLFGRYDEKADVWSLGVIGYLMLSGMHPFGGSKTEQVLQAVKTGTITMDGSTWRKISGEGKGMIKACLVKQPTSRASAAAALQHQWVQDTAGAESQDMSKLEMSGLKSFGRMHKLKRAAVTVIATQLSETRIEGLKSMFMGMDGNGDGTLSVAELKQGLAKAGIALPENLDRLLEEADTDGSGVVDYTEFLAATMDKKLYHQEDVVWLAFKKFDLDGSGTIDKQELRKVLGNDDVRKAMHLGDDTDKLEQIFSQVDENGDGAIDFNEFFTMMRGAEKSDKVKPQGRRLSKGSKGACGGRSNTCHIGIAMSDPNKRMEGGSLDA